MSVNSRLKAIYTMDLRLEVRLKVETPETSI